MSGRLCTDRGTCGGTPPGPGWAWIAGLRGAKNRPLAGHNARGPSAARPAETRQRLRFVPHHHACGLRGPRCLPVGVFCARCYASMRKNPASGVRSRVPHTSPPGNRPRSGTPHRLAGGGHLLTLLPISRKLWHSRHNFSDVTICPVSRYISGDVSLSPNPGRQPTSVCPTEFT